ncbi:MAG: FAD-binding protein [Moritella sp.]|uniref:electron transfer flavoprotein subunit alpha/FixB family protein n=1 Tax=Moritella sp. TaxID=78556 RepID=UPI0029A0383E|nr:FAD-binding protein [Moritella sp.]MDX2321567.1 FAD-binding protein [Moritella sp.]
MAILIVAEHDNHTLQAATLNVLTAAAEIATHTNNSELHLLIIGHDCQAAVDMAQGIAGLSQILVVDDQIYQYPLAENIAPLIVSLFQGQDPNQDRGQYSHIITSAGTTGKDYQPRVAALLDVAQISDIISVESADTFKRPIYAGNAIATVQSSDAIQVITVRSSAFLPAPLITGKQVPVVKLTPQASSGKSEFIKAELTQSSRPELTTAKVVIAGGRGMQNAENFALLDTLADQLNAAVGASRAAVDAGFVANDLQIGQTGKIVAPDLYIAIGISGAIQHIAGITGSKVIVAINSDPDAPIFDIADYGLVADLFEVLPALTAALKSKC